MFRSGFARKDVSAENLPGGTAVAYKRLPLGWLPSSSGQDAALSRLKPGFDSPWERHFLLASERSERGYKK